MEELPETYFFCRICRWYVEVTKHFFSPWFWNRWHWQLFVCKFILPFPFTVESIFADNWLVINSPQNAFKAAEALHNSLRQVCPGHVKKLFKVKGKVLPLDNTTYTVFLCAWWYSMHGRMCACTCESSILSSINVESLTAMVNSVYRSMV